ncbi:ErfK/YbiS/YcfS/YnhG family protein [Conexibacter woesei DSM 14684]|uniref:ErfK/YbiS/YcfS/YnhG family protein n=1 Tax=Conexibacter woesei (strain DSM 14684 / CCUG 47730 / CIP 108061 / JCM 11494 / NBRC 100937 / ID131577) TaxID=469383 RepID=D3F7G8_CONWI|nr:ErfK/YbiS/YcfS/YnhG family protein [Conexibacter woesei DSM 14684]
MPLRVAPGGRERRGSGLDGDAPWLLVLATGADRRGGCWVRVRLPGRPNDAAGWLPRSAVALQPTPWRIEVSRAARTITLTRAGRRAAVARVVIGKPSTRTPGGLFAVFNAWPNPPRDFSGTWIVALTAHSRALRRFDGGEGRIAIHGRGGASLVDPLGSARSHGCVRVANGDLDRIVRTVGWARLSGTPVRIR